jgi:hypothetical protein
VTAPTHPLIRLRLTLPAAERGAAHARKLSREDVANGFERAAILYRSSLRMGRRAMKAGKAGARNPANAVPVPDRTDETRPRMGPCAITPAPVAAARADANAHHAPGWTCCTLLSISRPRARVALPCTRTC